MKRRCGQYGEQSAREAFSPDGVVPSSCAQNSVKVVKHIPKHPRGGKESSAGSEARAMHCVS